MDSVTQIALGAAVGHAVLGGTAGRRAILWGAALGTLPDLDMFVPMGDAVASYTGHRSWSHSIFVLSAVAVPVGLLAARLHARAGASVRGWLGLAWAVFITHVLLDCFTVYGTQIFWPLARPPESWSTIFVIDPLYTLPLLGGIFAAWRWLYRHPRRAHRLNAAGLVLSSLYLLWTGVAKLHVEGVVAAQLAREGRPAARVMTTPTPLNSLLWRVVVMREDGYDEGYYSVVSGEERVGFETWPSRPELLDGLADHPPVARLAWFSHGFYVVSRVGDDVVISDLRMGAEPDYVFRFAVARAEAAAVIPRPPRKISSMPSLTQFPRIWARIWTPGPGLPE